MQSILDECEGKTEDPADCEEIFDFIQEECKAGGMQAIQLVIARSGNHFLEVQFMIAFVK